MNIASINDSFCLARKYTPGFISADIFCFGKQIWSSFPKSLKLEETCELRLINYVQGHMTYFHVIWRLVYVSYYNYILQHAEKKKILTAYPRKRMMIFRSDYKSNKFVSSSKTTAICFPD